MKKSSIIIKENQLIRLIYEAIITRNKSEPIEFVTSSENVSFIEYFGITPENMKRMFLRNGGDVICSFMGMKVHRMNFSLLNDLTSSNLNARGYYPCDYGKLELWVFFSESKSHGDDSIYIALSLKNNGKPHNGRKVGDIEVGDFIPTSRLSSKSIAVMVVDLLNSVYRQISGLDVKSRYMRL